MRNTIQLLNYCSKYKLNSTIIDSFTQNRLFEIDSLTYLIENSKNIIPFILLLDTIKAINNPITNICLITHIPLDFYLMKYFNNIQLVESFTGKIIGKHMLGYKFSKTNILPFNKYIHWLLGDRLFINRHLRRHGKKKLLEVALKNRWIIQPENIILRDIISLGFIDKNVFKSNIY